MNDSSVREDASALKRAAVALLGRSDGKILCVWNRRYRGWSMPGGLVEAGETVEAALARELREETSLELVSAELMFEGPHYTQIPKGRGSSVCVFRVVAYRGRARAMEAGCPVTWLTEEEFVRLTPFTTFYAQMFHAFPPKPALQPAVLIA